MTGAGQRLTSKQSCENVACDKTGSQSDWCQTDEKKIPVHCCGWLHACIIYIKCWSGERLLQCAHPQFLHSTAVLNIRSSTLAWLSVYVLTLFLSSSFFLCVCVFFGFPFSHCLDDQQIRLFSDMTLSDHSPRDFSQDGVEVKIFNWWTTCLFVMWESSVMYEMQFLFADSIFPVCKTFMKGEPCKLNTNVACNTMKRHFYLLWMCIFITIQKQ